MVFVSSYHIVSSLGLSVEENIKKINQNISGIQKNADTAFSPEPVYISLYDHSKLDEQFVEIISKNNYTSFEKLLIYSINQALNSCTIDIKDKNTLIVISTTKGNIDLLKPENLNHHEPERIQLWKSSEVIQNHFKNPNEVLTVSNACISGTLAIITAKRLLDAGKFKHAVVAGADILPEFTLSGFQVFKAVSEYICKPFDKNRNGMTPGEGAGTIILTVDPKKAKKPFINITGGASGNDANHISGPSKTGMEPSITINKSIEDAGLTSKDIDFISAHGTATIYNDESEAKALTISDLKTIPTNSFKGYFGHTFGAAGIIETIVSIESIFQNKLYKSYGYEEQGTENKLNIIKENVNKDIIHVLKTASGFGGCNAALVFGKNNNSKPSNLNVAIHIIKVVKISNHQLFINQAKQNISTNELFDRSENDFLKLLYKFSDIQYPKFFKMDTLCKTAFMASEFLLMNSEIKNKYKDDEIAVILSNGSSSLNTDIEYQNTINDRSNYFPSPAIFVYTLPNIMIGEICIRHKIKGENNVFISKTFNKDFILNYSKILFETGKTKACIAGRIDHDYPTGKIFAELYLIDSKK